MRRCYIALLILVPLLSLIHLAFALFAVITTSKLSSIEMGVFTVISPILLFLYFLSLSVEQVISLLKDS